MEKCIDFEGLMKADVRIIGVDWASGIACVPPVSPEVGIRAHMVSNEKS